MGGMGSRLGGVGSRFTEAQDTSSTKFVVHFGQSENAEVSLLILLLDWGQVAIGLADRV